MHTVSTVSTVSSGSVGKGGDGQDTYLLYLKLITPSHRSIIRQYPALSGGINIFVTHCTILPVVISAMIPLYSPWLYASK